jgi:hypothetical protein
MVVVRRKHNGKRRSTCGKSCNDDAVSAPPAVAHEFNRQRPELTAPHSCALSTYTRCLRPRDTPE